MRVLHEPKNQAGTVLITVVLIASFVVVLVMEAIKAVRYQQVLSTNLINRDQAYSYLMGMEDLAKIWLRKAFKEKKENYVHLNQAWAKGDFTFPIDGGGMTASFKDMQSCFNLNTIALRAARSTPSGRGNPAFAGKETIGQKVLTRLINQVNDNTEIRPSALAVAVKDWIDKDIEPSGVDGVEDDFYQSLEVPYRAANGLIAHESELRVIKGFDRNIYNLLRPHICVLPDPNVKQININTIKQGSEVVVYSVLGSKKITLAEVKTAISNRGEKGFKSVGQFLAEFAGKRGINSSMLTVKSDYFQMTAKAEIGTTRVAMKTLFKKDDKNNFQVISRYFGKE